MPEDSIGSLVGLLPSRRAPLVTKMLSSSCLESRLECILPVIFRASSGSQVRAKDCSKEKVKRVMSRKEVVRLMCGWRRTKGGPSQCVQAPAQSCSAPSAEVFVKVPSTYRDISKTRPGTILGRPCGPAAISDAPSRKLAELYSRCSDNILGTVGD